MALNKFSDIEVENDWMNINCNLIRCKNLSIDGSPLMKLKFSRLVTASIVDTVLELPLAENNLGSGEFKIDANEFIQGSVGHIVMSGILNALGPTDLTIKVYGGPTGSNLLCTLPIVGIPASAQRAYLYNFHYTIYDEGTTGVARIQYFSDFKFNPTGSLVHQGLAISSIESANFSTEVDNVFRITVQFGAASIFNAISSSQVVFTSSV